MGFSSRINMVNPATWWRERFVWFTCFMVKFSVCQHMDLFKTPFLNPCIEYPFLKHWLPWPSPCSLSAHPLFPHRTLGKVAVTLSPQSLANRHKHSLSPPEWAVLPPCRAEEKPGVSRNSRLQVLRDWPVMNYPKGGLEGLKHKADQYSHHQKEGCSPISCAILEVQLSKP